MEKKKAPIKKAKKKKKVAEKRGAKTEENESPMGEEAGGGTGSGMDEGQTEDEAEDEKREHVVSAVTGNVSLVSSSSSSSSSSSHNGGFIFLSVFYCSRMSKDVFISSTGSSQDAGPVAERAHVNGEKSFLTAKKEEKDEKKKDKSGLFVFLFFFKFSLTAQDIQRDLKKQISITPLTRNTAPSNGPSRYDAVCPVYTSAYAIDLRTH